MAATATVMNYFRECLGKKLVDFPNDTMRLVLCNSTPVLSTNNWSGSAGWKAYADISSNELATANGYTQNTATLGTKTVTYGTSRVRYSSAAVQWSATSSGLNPYFAFLYDATATGNPLVLHIDLNATTQGVTASAGGTLTITPDATDGWFYI